MDQKAFAVIQVRKTEDLNSALAECQKEEVEECNAHANWQGLGNTQIWK